jgi:asparagine synthase (glutamine-hydrolysing)
MAGRLIHRGPDDRGTWVDPDAGIALGFRRLAIVDLSPAGRQPMHSASGRFVLVFNGEIYNHKELRSELVRTTADRFRGHSDTETLLAAIEHWGLEETIRRAVGMFALALWDRSTRTLHLVRDRLGEKPLYYGFAATGFVFGSELKALRAHPQFSNRLNPSSLALYLRLGYVPEPFSIFEGIFKLPPGAILRVATAPDVRPGQPSVYWSIAAAAEQGSRDPFTGSEAEAIDELERRLGRAVAGQMVADVALGGLLSGGLDSSTVVALMQSHASRPVRTFTIGFNQPDFDESQAAAAVARHLGTEHATLVLTPDAARDLIPELPELFDEPFADSSALPTLLVARLARRSVTVGLSGDGGDELFGGYPWHLATPDLWHRLRYLRPPRGILTRSQSANAGPSVLRRVRAAPLLDRIPLANGRLRRLANLLANADSPESFHLVLRSQWPEPVALFTQPPIEPLDQTAWGLRADWLDVSSRLMLADSLTYLPGDILTKVDRCSMRVGLECRAPFLDHRVVEFAWRLPSPLKLSRGQGKRILRRLLGRHLPAELIDRPKRGFSIPIAAWLRGPLRSWARSLLETGLISTQDLLRPEPIRRSWKQFEAGSDREAERLWCILVFFAWQRAVH